MLQTSESLNLLAKSKNLKSQIKEMISDPDLYSLPRDMNKRDHSKILDSILGFRILKIEQKLLKQFKPFNVHEEKGDKEYFKGSEAWIGLHPQTLLTPYSELIEILNSIASFPICTIVDFGCAYGRIGIVVNSIFPKCIFWGYEIVGKRAAEARRVYALLNLSQHEIYETNILSEDFKIPKASAYFIYDFSRVEDIKNILNKIEQLVGRHEFVLIARGEEVRSIIQMYYPIFLTKHMPIYKKDWAIFFITNEIA